MTNANADEMGSLQMPLPCFFDEVDLQWAPVPRNLAGATARGVLWQAASKRFLLEVPEVARYLVEDGRRITIEATVSVDRAHQDEVVRFLRMIPLAALLFQRNLLALHAAAALPPPDLKPRRVLVLAGDSGAGKSSLLAALLQHGWSVLADELTPVDLDSSGALVTYPTFPEVMLWPDSMDKLGIATPSPPDAIPVGGRHALHLQDQLVRTPQPLGAILWLCVHHQDEIEIRPLEGSDRFRAPAMLSSNSHIAEALLDKSAYFRLAAAIAQSVPLYRLGRPRGRWSLEELLDKIMKQWQILDLLS